MRKFAILATMLVALTLAVPAMAGVDIPMKFSYNAGQVKATALNSGAAYNGLIPLYLQYQVADQNNTTGITHYIPVNTNCQLISRGWENGHMTFLFQGIDIGTWKEGQQGGNLLWGTQREINTYLALSDPGGRKSNWTAMNYAQKNLGWENLDLVTAFYPMGVTNGREGKALQIFDASYSGGFASAVNTFNTGLTASAVTAQNGNAAWETQDGYMDADGVFHAYGY